jgi:hypothetical protein
MPMAEELISRRNAPNRHTRNVAHREPTKNRRANRTIPTSDKTPFAFQHEARRHAMAMTHSISCHGLRQAFVIRRHRWSSLRVGHHWLCGREQRFEADTEEASRLVAIQQRPLTCQDRARDEPASCEKAFGRHGAIDIEDRFELLIEVLDACPADLMKDAACLALSSGRRGLPC